LIIRQLKFSTWLKEVKQNVNGIRITREKVLFGKSLYQQMLGEALSGSEIIFGHRISGTNLIIVEFQGCIIDFHQLVQLRIKGL